MADFHFKLFGVEWDRGRRGESGGEDEKEGRDKTILLWMLALFPGQTQHGPWNEAV